MYGLLWVKNQKPNNPYFNQLFVQWKFINFKQQLLNFNYIIMENVKFTQEQIVMFDFLNSLRLSGITNMIGATQYLVEVFKISDDYASDVLYDWM